MPRDRRHDERLQPADEGEALGPDERDDVGNERGADPADTGLGAWAKRRLKALVGVPIGAVVGWVFVHLGLDEILGVGTSDELEATIIVVATAAAVERIRNFGQSA